MQIFIHRDDEDFGPYTVEEVQHHLESGDLRREDYAWYKGAPDWMPLEKIPGVIPPDTEQPSAPSPARARSHTGLPPWIPPRRGDDPELAGGKPTSFASPASRPLGITTISPIGGKPAASDLAARTSPKPPAAAKAAMLSAPVAHTVPASTMPDESDEVVEPAPPRSLRAAGLRNMLLGGGWFVAGSGVTLYAHETGLGHAHGGIYLAAAVAIAAGLFQFLRGANQYRKA